MRPRGARHEAQEADKAFRLTLPNSQVDAQLKSPAAPR